MSYSFSVSGHVDSKKAEAEVLAKAVGFAEAAGAEGHFSFVGTHFSVLSGLAAEACARAGADEDDQVAIPSGADETEA